MASFCTKCGASIPADAAFCEMCGVAMRPGTAPVSTSAVSARATVNYARKRRMVALVVAGLIATIGGSAWWWLARSSTPSSGILKSAVEESLNISGTGRARSLGCIPWVEEPYFSSEQIKANFELWRRDAGAFGNRMVLIVPTKYAGLGNALVNSGMAEGPVGKGDGTNLIQGQVLWFVFTEKGIRSVLKEGKTTTTEGQTIVGGSQLCFSDGAYVEAITAVRGPVDVNGKTAVVATVQLGFKNQQAWTKQDEIKSFFDTKVRQRNMVFLKSDGHWKVAAVGGLPNTIDTDGLRSLLLQRTEQPENATSSGSSGPTTTTDASKSSLVAKLGSLFSSNDKIIGKWKSKSEPLAQIEFFEDGRAAMAGNMFKGANFPGKWFRGDGGRIQADIEIMGGTYTFVFETVADELELEDHVFGTKQRLVRVK